jgi:hypothetical protein
MLRLSVKAEVEALRPKLTQKALANLPYATARALTATARRAADGERQAIRSGFQSPTPFTVNSVAVVPATKANPTAIVGVRPIAAKYLAPYEFGGAHFLNPSRAGGTLLNPKDVALNAYGNLPARTLARLRARRDVFIGEVMTKSGPVDGVWRRVRALRAAAARPGQRRRMVRGRRGRPAMASLRGLDLIVRFGDALPVRQGLGFRERGRAAMMRDFPAELRRQLLAAIATSRR